MRYQIMSRKTAQEYSALINIPKTIIISISDVGQEPNSFAENKNIIDVLRLSFNDVDRRSEQRMSVVQAYEVWTFISEHIDEAEQIIVHCGAGISRSAGVCAAIQYVLEGTDRAVFDNPKYNPNVHCYRTVCDAFFGDYEGVRVPYIIRSPIYAFMRKNRD